jgi:hypothetical protein
MKHIYSLREESTDRMQEVFNRMEHVQDKLSDAEMTRKASVSSPRRVDELVDSADTQNEDLAENLFTSRLTDKQKSIIKKDPIDPTGFKRLEQSQL